MVMRRMKWVVVVFVIIGLTFLYHNYIRNPENQGEKPEFREDQIKVKPVQVKVKKAFIGDLIKYVHTSGVTRAMNEVSVKPLVSGVVKTVRVHDGQQVDKGEVLVELDDREYRVALQEAESELVRARLEYALLLREAPSDPPAGTPDSLQHLIRQYEEARQAYLAGDLDVQKFLEIDRKYQIALILSGKKRQELMAQKSGLSAAEAKYARAQYELDNCRIRAPFSGIVADVNVFPGDLITTGQELMRLVDLIRLRLRLQVLESDIGYVQPGEQVKAVFAAFPDTFFIGRVVGVNPTVNPQTRSCTVEAILDNPSGLLKSGMFATVRIAVNRYAHRLLVPRAAVLVRDQRKLVFIVREGKAIWCYVETGLENDDYLEIVSSSFDLKPGEPVIVEGHFALAHNAPVEIIQ